MCDWRVNVSCCHKFLNWITRSTFCRVTLRFMINLFNLLDLRKHGCSLIKKNVNDRKGEKKKIFFFHPKHLKIKRILKTINNESQNNIWSNYLPVLGSLWITTKLHEAIQMWFFHQLASNVITGRCLTITTCEMLIWTQCICETDCKDSTQTIIILFCIYKITKTKSTSI